MKTSSLTSGLAANPTNMTVIQRSTIKNPTNKAKLQEGSSLVI
jgi:hypothetical protein